MRLEKLVVIAGLIGTSFACTAVPGTDTVNVDECAGDADVDDVTAIAYDFEVSAHEMVVCGSLTNLLINKAIQSVGNLIGDPVSMPEAFSESNGVYTTTGSDATMDIRLVDGTTTLTANLFDPDNWLVNATPTDVGEDDVEIHFDSAGPLAYLLGKGAQPSSPLLLTQDDLESIGLTLASLELDLLIGVDDDSSDRSVITYIIDNPPKRLDALSIAIDMEQLEVEGGREDLDQSIATRTWDVTYIDETNALDGVIELEFVGGPFDFEAVYTYLPTDSDPSIAVACL